MGRKPNQLILEFFERGPKLEDASNRYQHTCKSCGEKFPKGRIDSLTNHLVKKCPALPLRDRQRAVLQFHDLPADLPDMAHMANMHNQVQNGPSMNLPFTPSKQGMSALETLAEVSRQHLDLSGKRISGKQGRISTPPPPQNNQGAFMDEFIIHDEPSDRHDLSAITQSMDASSAPALPSLYQFHGSLQHSPTTSPHLANMPLSTSGSMHQMVPSLVMTASAANQLTNIMPSANGLMEPDLNLSNAGTSDSFFHSQERQQWPNLPQSSIDPLLHDHHNQQMLSKDDNLHKMSPPRPIAMNPNSSQAHFTQDFSVNHKPSKPKVRGRFSDTRRKEVQEIRKRGACIRCRMLKKPCSGDSPCNTCQNVESARLWKQPCIRTRIAEEFNLYSAGLHGFLAFQAVSQAKSHMRMVQIPGRIEATHDPESGVFATFVPMKSQSQAMAGSDIDPMILASLPSSNLEVIDGDDDIAGKVDHYVKKMASFFFDCEDSNFIKTTLRVALSIASTNRDGLLPKVLELWNFTRILTKLNPQWHIFTNPSLAAQMVTPIMSSTDLEDPSRTPISPDNDSPSYDLIKMQLQGAIEKRAACLAKVVMNDLERRLLQRQQANPFETFLVAVILLACVERMCWLFKTWEENTAPQPPTTENDQPSDAHLQPQPLPSQSSELQSEASLAQALQSASGLVSIPQNTDPIPPPHSPHPHHHLPHSLPHHPKWPFDKPPAYYSQQGDRFSDILNMLLKMRGVPPKPTPRAEDGMLLMWGDDVDEKVREWYEGIAVTTENLAERADARFLGVDPSEWEGKFWSKIIGVAEEWMLFVRKRK